jgi:Lon protease-like protein
MTELPLFPLPAQLMPYGKVPLQIFEQRYLGLVKDCLKSDSAFGVVWIRRGAEVAQHGTAAPALGNYGTTARIVDWDQLPNGLLGVTVQGGQRFDLDSTEVRPNGLVVGQVELRPPAAYVAVEPQWQTLLDVLHSLETHPHVQRMALEIDYNDAWQVAYTLVQLLPLEEAIKYQLLGLDDIQALMGEIDVILNQISGEDD